MGTKRKAAPKDSAPESGHSLYLKSGVLFSCPPHRVDWVSLSALIQTGQSLHFCYGAQNIVVAMCCALLPRLTMDPTKMVAARWFGGQSRGYELPPHGYA